MFQTLKQASLFILCLSMIVCGTATRSAAQSPQTVPAQVKEPWTSAPGNNNDVFDLQQVEAIDPKSFLLFMGTQIHETELDCSHFVQFLYEQAGLYYEYMPSRVLYTGIKEFKRVLHPKAGDLVVWKGHVGIVVDPKQTTFLSSLRSGVKQSSYESNYWKHRGRPRFLRYVVMREKNKPTWTGRKTIASVAARPNPNIE
jgi:hypothetical protein